MPKKTPKNISLFAAILRSIEPEPEEIISLKIEEIYEELDSLNFYTKGLIESIKENISNKLTERIKENNKNEKNVAYYANPGKHYQADKKGFKKETYQVLIERVASIPIKEKPVLSYQGWEELIMSTERKKSFVSRYVRLRKDHQVGKKGLGKRVKLRPNTPMEIPCDDKIDIDQAKNYQSKNSMDYRDGHKSSNPPKRSKIDSDRG